MIKFNHINIRTTKVKETCEFYEKVLNVRKGRRPAFPFPGAWLYSGTKAIIHIVEVLSNSDTHQSLHHIAFEGDDLQTLLNSLAKHHIEYKVAKIPKSNEVQVFVQDPNKLTIEILFTDEGVKNE